MISCAQPRVTLILFNVPPTVLYVCIGLDGRRWRIGWKNVSFARRLIRSEKYGKRRERYTLLSVILRCNYFNRIVLR